MSDDWDVRIDNPPPRPSQTVTIEFVDGDYRQPEIVDDELESDHELEATT